MKKTDLLVFTVFLLIVLSFVLFPGLVTAYETLNGAHAYLMSFIKFALLATFGECLGLRIRTGVYNKPGFGIIPRAIVWGFLGISIKIAFVIFGEGSPVMLKTMGVVFPDSHPADILRTSGFSGLKLLAAFSVSTMLNLFFAPVFMAAHRITDMHIISTGGTLNGFFTPIRVARHIGQGDWVSFWDFVLKKTIPLFWIPAQTLNFMLPEGYRVLIAAIYSIILGVLLSVAAIGQKR